MSKITLGDVWDNQILVQDNYSPPGEMLPVPEILSTEQSQKIQSLALTFCTSRHCTRYETEWQFFYPCNICNWDAAWQVYTQMMEKM